MNYITIAWEFLTKNKTNTIIYAVLIILILGIIRNSTLKTKNSDCQIEIVKLQSKIDSLENSKKFSDKVVEINTQILESTNQEIIKKKDELEKRIAKLDTTDIELNYERNLRTIKEYLEDRKRYNLK
jgi:7-cyano-7-deazaguanine synthase in queuosine biosynthesis